MGTRERRYAKRQPPAGLGAGRVAALFALLSLLTGCAAPRGAADCPLGTGTSMRVVELYFGRSVDGDRQVSDAQWERFRDEVISPNVPDGYTVLEGTGAWLNPKTHATETEKTKVLIVATPDSESSRAAIQRVRTAYARAFKQTSVGMTSRLACGSFD